MADCYPAASLIVLRLDCSVVVHSSRTAIEAASIVQPMTWEPLNPEADNLPPNAQEDAPETSKNSTVWVFALCDGLLEWEYREASICQALDVRREIIVGQLVRRDEGGKGRKMVGGYIGQSSALATGRSAEEQVLVVGKLVEVAHRRDDIVCLSNVSALWSNNEKGRDGHDIQAQLLERHA